MSLKDRIVFIGIGQCGGNIAAEAAQNGFKSGAINTSNEDLNSETMRNIPHKLTIGGNIGGCAKERKLAQQIVKKEYQKIIDFIGNNFLENSKKLASEGQKPIVYLCFSTSGGTGSGVGPILLSVLKKVYSEVCFGVIAVIPSEDESLIAFNNSLKCLEELYKMDIPIFIADNSNARCKESRKAIYNSVNKEIIQSIMKIVKDRESSNISNIDDRDKSKILTTNGISVIVSTPLMETELKDEASFSKAIENSFFNNVYAKINLDKHIKIAGFFFEIPEKVTKFINYSMILSNIGTPLEIFEGIYPSPNKDDKTAVVTTILTGLSFPEDVIKDMTDKLNNDGKNVKKSNKKTDLFKNDSFDDLFGNSVDDDTPDLFADFSSTELDNDEDEEIDIESIFSNF